MGREPIDLDDEDDDRDEPPRRRRVKVRVLHDRPPRETFDGFPPVLFAAGKLASLALAGAAAVKAFDAPAVQASTWAGLACLCGIVSRLFQVEEYRAHDRLNQPRG
jgi:hypothetical protein